MTKTPKESINSEDSARRMCRLASSKRAHDIVVIDMRKTSGLCDYFVIAGAESNRKVKTICDTIEEGMEARGVRCLHREGVQEGLWGLLDYGDVVVHIFHDETRKFYDLERLWSEAPMIRHEEPEEI